MSKDNSNTRSQTLDSGTRSSVKRIDYEDGKEIFFIAFDNSQYKLTPGELAKHAEDCVTVLMDYHYEIFVEE